MSGHGITPISEILGFFQGAGKRVISFAGFAELGYEDPAIVEKVAAEVLDGRNPNDVLVNSGTLLREGGQEGIARIYALAKQRGIATSGIHPGIALDFASTHTVSPFVDHVFFVDDATWGGLYQGAPSPTLQTILDVTDELVVVGGGKHAAEELLAFSHRGKSVRYFPARMNRGATDEWRQRSGIDAGALDGAAFEVWKRLSAAEHESRG